MKNIYSLFFKIPKIWIQNRILSLRIDNKTADKREVTKVYPELTLHKPLTLVHEQLILVGKVGSN